VFAASASAVLYGVYEDFNGNYMSIDVAVVYNTLHKTVWGAAVSWVIFACATGNGGKMFQSIASVMWCGN